MRKDPDLSYMNKNGKRVSGTAAALHFIYDTCQGLSNYNDMIGKIYAEKAVKEFSEDIQKAISRKSKRSHLKVV